MLEWMYIYICLHYNLRFLDYNISSINVTDILGTWIIHVSTIKFVMIYRANTQFVDE